MPEILYFAPPASLTEMTEVPVQTDGNSERDKLGVDDDEEQKVRGPQARRIVGNARHARGAGGALPGRLAHRRSSAWAP